MATQITEGVKASRNYLPGRILHPASEHMFAYKILIENLTGYSVTSRHWLIFDSNGSNTEVEGEGVVGLQPVIEPGESHEYVSMQLKTDMGSMRDLPDATHGRRREIYVTIPEFH